MFNVFYLQFIPWKKLYHRLRKNHGDSYSAVDALMTKANLNLPSKSLLGLIKLVNVLKFILHIFSSL